jgi:serine/threonine protein kinase
MQTYGREVDWYCLGAVIYEMLVGLVRHANIF